MKFLTDFLDRLMPTDPITPPQTEVAVLVNEKQPEFRGNLALYRDRSQHRRFAARYEDLMN